MFGVQNSQVDRVHPSVGRVCVYQTVRVKVPDKSEEKQLYCRGFHERGVGSVASLWAVSVFCNIR